MKLNCIICKIECEVKDPRAKIKLCSKCNTKLNRDILLHLITSGKKPEEISADDFKFKRIVNEYGEVM